MECLKFVFIFVLYLNASE